MKKLFFIFVFIFNINNQSISFNYEQDNVQYRICAILVRTEAEAKDIILRLKEGEDFAELAKKYSIGAGRNNGGDLGYFSYGDMLPDLENEVKRLKVGQYSGIISTSQGYFVIKKTDEGRKEEIAAINATSFYSQADLQRIVSLFNEGVKYYNLSNFSSAIQKWEQGLKIAKIMNHKKAISDFTGSLGNVYHNLDKFSKALSYYEVALKIKREIGDIKGIGTTLIKIGLVHWNLGDYPKALSYYKSTLKIAQEIGDKNGEGNALGNIGTIYSDIGDFSKALTFYEEALEIHREIGNKEEESDLLGNIGIVYSNLNEYQKALSYYEQVMKIEREIGNTLGIGADLTNIGTIYSDIGDFSKALTFYEEALKISEEIGDQMGVGANLINIGVAYSDLGDFSKALSYYEQALKIKREIGHKKGMGGNLMNIGNIYLNLGDYKKAFTYYEDALNIAQEIGDKKSEGNALGNIGVIYSDLGDFSKALSFLEQSLKIRKEIADKIGEGTELNNIGIVYTNFYEYSKALSCYEKALEVLREISVPTETVEANMADIWLNMGNYKEAEEIFLRLESPIHLGRLNFEKQNFDKAIKYYTQSLKEDLIRRNTKRLFVEYIGLGRSYEYLKDFSQSLEHYANAVTLAKEQREGLEEGERSKFFTVKVPFKRTEPYEGLIRLHAHKGAYSEAFFYAENLKARLLSEAIAKGHAKEGHVLPAKLEKEENECITQIRGLRKQMEALYKNQVMESYYEKEEEIKTVKEKQQVFISHLRQSYPEYAAVHYPQPIKLEEVILTPNEALIEFEVTEIATIVFLINNGKVKSRRIEISRDSLQTLVTEYRGYFEDITQTSQLGQYSPEKGKVLYNLLFGDLLAYVPENTTLIIVPDEFLGILPFEALVMELPEEEKIGESDFGPFPLGVTYLADKYTLTYAQSATSLTFLRILEKDKVQGKNMLVVADPIFSNHDSRLIQLALAESDETTINLMGAISDWKQMKQMGVAGIREREEERDVSEITNELFPRLEKTEVLAQEIEALFGNKAIILSGSEAREDQVKGMDFTDYRYLTFATHGILDNTVPYIREPALVLNQINNPEGYDGFLTMNEVMGMKLDAEVVALTACETGLGKNVSGEGVMGMGRAFQYAGARNVLVSLWSVAETSATELTAAFYKYAKEGHEPKDAISLARNEIRRKGYEHPFYWASFVMYGQ